MQLLQILKTNPRDDIIAELDNGTHYRAARHTTIEAVLIQAVQDGVYPSEPPIIACVCDGRLRELSYPLTNDVKLKPVTLADSDGGRIYRRSLIFLMTTALDELLGEHTPISVNYAVPDGGYYCELVGRDPLTLNEMNALEAKMREIIADNSPIVKEVVPLDVALELFTERRDDDKVRLLQYRTRNELTLYRMRDNRDYYFGYMTPSSGYLTLFKLIYLKGEKGFILQYPRRNSPQELGRLEAYSKLRDVFAQANRWLERLNLEDIGTLNKRVSEDDVQEMVLVAEALHEQNIAQIAERVVQEYERHGTRLVTIAGPSSSGKTTFAKRLAIQLLAQGVHPFTLEMDNFFVDRPLTPRDENGDYDFEHLEAIDLTLLNDTLQRLLAGEDAPLPKFDFIEGKSTTGRTVQLLPKQIIIMEGIHGLNPRLFRLPPSQRIFRIYVSALTQLNIDRHNRVPTTDVRLLRRIIRDARSRGNMAVDTLNRWASVRRGEKHNIFAHQENADAIFNSALVYELAALRPLAEPLLLQVPPQTPAQIEANRLLSFLRWVIPFKPHHVALIPSTSLLREFVGGSLLEDYHPGT